MRSLLAFFAPSILLASTTTTVHGVHIDPNDIIKTIESKCGDIIDCVDIYKQPSLKNPLLKDHKILVLYIPAYGVNGPYHGASAWLPIWKVGVGPSEFSKSYLAIASPTVREFTPIPGKDPPNIDNQIALGIATSKKHAIGAKYDKFSTVGGTTYFTHVVIYRDDGPAVWWVSLMDEPIVYFHESAFAAPFIESFHNEMGGHVLDRRPGGRHTLTPMGSGMYPSDGLQNAACIHAYLAIAYTGADQVDDPVNSIVTHPKCYDVKDDGPDLYRPGINVAFGGPGGYDCDHN
ncbi:uncharacterized protein LOC127754591 [Oryza glaberrima]|uniref:uncharacterized protein LOC127754591 n=1 Tax=Oryza glaberrima TaxID=4538 RepID=UPI00224C4C5F|nr:uncharacterized protein LOC127754591 [Oryza glaberrima]